MSQRKMKVDNFVIYIRCKIGAPNAHFIVADEYEINSSPKRTRQSKRSLNQNPKHITKKMTGERFRGYQKKLKKQMKKNL